MKGRRENVYRGAAWSVKWRLFSFFSICLSFFFPLLLAGSFPLPAFFCRLFFTCFYFTSFVTSYRLFLVRICYERHKPAQWSATPALSLHMLVSACTLHLTFSGRCATRVHVYVHLSVHGHAYVHVPIHSRSSVCINVAPLRGFLAGARLYARERTCTIIFLRVWKARTTKNSARERLVIEPFSVQSVYRKTFSNRWNSFGVNDLDSSLRFA